MQTEADIDPLKNNARNYRLLGNDPAYDFEDEITVTSSYHMVNRRE